ncbi:hypothetical protein GCM10010363_12970 [Streptomyces omiyaensis]|nr:hypothetical protein GCM10010363_12970 [Streptomyces omiyaensis]
MRIALGRTGEAFPSRPVPVGEEPPHHRAGAGNAVGAAFPRGDIAPRLERYGERPGSLSGPGRVGEAP